MTGHQTHKKSFFNHFHNPHFAHAEPQRHQKTFSGYHIVQNPYNWNILFFSLFHILYKSRPQKLPNILTFPYKFHRQWIRVHFLPPAIVILTFAYFFVTNLAIVRARTYGYVSVYDMITSVIQVKELIFLWQYRVIFLFLFDQKIFCIQSPDTKSSEKELVFSHHILYNPQNMNTLFLLFYILCRPYQLPDILHVSLTFL